MVGTVQGGNGCTGTGQYTVTHTHDGLGRLTRDENGSLRPVDDAFDAAGNRLRSAPVTDGSGGITTTTTVFAVNLLDQAVSETRTEGSTIRTSEVTYDPAGNPVDRCRWDGATAGDCPAGSNPPTALSTTTYDAQNRRISVTDGATGQTTRLRPGRQRSAHRRLHAGRLGR